MSNKTLIDYLDRWTNECGDKVWLRDLKEEGSDDTTWSQASSQINAAAAAIESRFGSGVNMLLLSGNCSHWVLADLAIIRSGNVTVPLFTTLPAATAEYISSFVEAKVVFVGEAGNWDSIKSSLPDDITVVSLPGATLDDADLSWDDLLKEGEGKQPEYQNQADDMISLVFTSGTTGMPKGVIQTHNTCVIPISRGETDLQLPQNLRCFSYLPLSHIAERQLVAFTSMYYCGEISFNRSLETLVPDLQRTKPHFFFGAPRVWEQFQQAVIGKFGGQEAFDAMFNADPEGIGKLVIEGLGLSESVFCLTASAPTPPPLIHWYESLGLQLMEGFGQTEAMYITGSQDGERKIGSIGKPLDGVEYKITEEGELILRTDGLTPGYYKQPEKTAELIQDGWLHTGDKARVDEDGFLYITGRVKDYFKTIQGKFVAPPPIEGQFSENKYVEQQCLMGRGFSKTVMVAVLTESAGDDKEKIESSVSDTIQQINDSIEKHARIGAVILTREPWTSENEILTPTLKIRREKIDERFAELGERLARESAEQRRMIVHWWE